MLSQKLRFGLATTACFMLMVVARDFTTAQDELLNATIRVVNSVHSNGATSSLVQPPKRQSRSIRFNSNSSKSSSVKRSSTNQEDVTQRNVEIRAFAGDIQLRTFDFSGQTSPTQNRQVIVEMKKAMGSKNERVIRGMIAEESWIDSTSGAIQFYNANELFESGTLNQYWIGVRCVEVPSVSSVNKGEQTVLRVEDVVPESAASEAGIEVKDLIRSWNNNELNSVPELVEQIQTNQLKLATVSLVRNGKQLDVQLRPRSRTSGVTKVRTIFAPSTELKVAEERIGQLKEMILAKDVDKDQLFRFVVVGPGVNFGQGEIELQLKPDLQKRHAELTRMIDRVAEKKFSVMFRDDNVRLMDAAELDLSFNVDELVPEQIWQSFEIGSNGRSLSFSTIAPQVLTPQTNGIRVKVNKVDRIDGRKNSKTSINRTLNDLSVGRFIFESPHREFNIEHIVRKEQELQDLQSKFEKIQRENSDLKAELKAIKQRLESKK